MWKDIAPKDFWFSNRKQESRLDESRAGSYVID
jgi:hypothetical protein